MRLSVWPINQQPLDAVIDVVKHAEATGWDGAWVADHLMGAGVQAAAPVLEAWTTLTVLAGETARMRLGTLVLSATFRPVGVLAKMVATLAQRAPGRLVLGIGTGWDVGEHEAFGIDLPSPAIRLGRLAETCAALHELLTTGESSFVGQHLRLARARSVPLPPAPVPILIGAKGDRALRVVARHADEWNLWADAAVLRQRREVLARACEAAGRDVATIRTSAQSIMLLDGGPAADVERWQRAGLPTLAGTVAAVQDQVGAMVEAGLDELVVPDFSLGTGQAKLDALDRIREDVLSSFVTKRSVR